MFPKTLTAKIVKFQDRRFVLSTNTKNDDGISCELEIWEEMHPKIWELVSTSVLTNDVLEKLVDSFDSLSTELNFKKGN